jgi:hypothetical protein
MIGMKRTSQVRLTLVASMAALFAASPARASVPKQYCLDQSGRVIDNSYCEGRYWVGTNAIYHFHYGGKPKHVPGGTIIKGGSDTSTARGVVGHAGGAHSSSAGHSGSAGS